MTYEPTVDTAASIAALEARIVRLMCEQREEYVRTPSGSRSTSRRKSGPERRVEAAHIDGLCTALSYFTADLTPFAVRMRLFGRLFDRPVDQHPGGEAARRD